MAWNWYLNVPQPNFHIHIDLLKWIVNVFVSCHLAKESGRPQAINTYGGYMELVRDHINQQFHQLGLPVAFRDPFLSQFGASIWKRSATSTNFLGGRSILGEFPHNDCFTSRTKVDTLW